VKEKDIRSLETILDRVARNTKEVSNRWERRGEREGGGERERCRERETGIQMDNQTAEAETYRVYMCGVSITASFI
jgi:hypothetical protein